MVTASGSGQPRKPRVGKPADKSGAASAETPPRAAPSDGPAQPARPAQPDESVSESVSEPMRECPGCGREVPQAIRECPACQFVVSRYVAEGTPAPEPEPELHPVPIPEDAWRPPSETPNFTPYVAILAAAVIICVGSWMFARSLRTNMDAQLANQAAVSTNPTLPASEANPPAGSAPVAQTSSPPSWHKVVKFKTGGTAGLASFTVRGSQWRITWSTKPPAGRTGRFSVGLTSEGSPTPVTIASATTSKQGATTLTGAGDYTLNIDSPQPCLVMVEDYY